MFLCTSENLQSQVIVKHSNIVEKKSLDHRRGKNKKIFQMKDRIRIEIF